MLNLDSVNFFLLLMCKGKNKSGKQRAHRQSQLNDKKTKTIRRFVGEVLKKNHHYPTIRKW